MCGGKGGILSELLHAVLCTTVVHSGMHTNVSSFVGFSFLSTKPRDWLGRNDLFCVEWDVKPYSSSLSI